MPNYPINGGDFDPAADYDLTGVVTCNDPVSGKQLANYDWVLSQIGGGGGNVVSDGTATTGQICKFTSSGFNIGASTISEVSGVVTAGENTLNNGFGGATIKGILNSASINCNGNGNIPGPGSVSVTNGSPIVIGDSTSFLSTFGINSAIKIDGVSYTVIALYGDNALQLSENYSGASDSGVSYFYDTSFLNFINSDNQSVFSINNSGGMTWTNFPSLDNEPQIKTESSGGVVSALNIKADILNNFISKDASYNLYNSNNEQILNISGLNGNSIILGDLTIGQPSYSGRNLSMPVSGYSTYSPVFSSNTIGGFSEIQVFSDNIVFNIDAFKFFSVKGDSGESMSIDSPGYMKLRRGLSTNSGLPSEINITDNIDGTSLIKLNNGAAELGYIPLNDILYLKNGLKINSDGNPRQLAFSVYDNSIGDSALYADTLNHNFGTIGTDYIVYSAPPSYEEMFHVVSKNGDENLGRVTTRFNTIDDGEGNASFLIGGDIKIQRNEFANPTISFLGTNTISFSQPEVFNGISASWDLLSLQLNENFRFKGYLFYGETSASSFNIMTGFRGALAKEDAITFDIPSNGEFYFWDNVSSSGRIASENELAAIGTAASLLLEDSDSIPATPTTGVRFFSQYDVGLGKSVAFYKNSVGDVIQIGAGSGGGGTVTNIDVTNDLTVNGVPAGSFSVSGTIGLSDTGITSGTRQFAQISIDSKGRATSASSLGSYDNGAGVLALNGTGTLYHPSTTTGTIVGDSAGSLDDAISNYVAVGTGARAGNQGVSLGAGAGNTTSGHNTHLFLGYGATATINNLINIAAIGPNSRVSRNNTYSYGDFSTPVSHGFNTPEPDSTLHIKSNSTSGSFGGKGVLRLNGINDPVNSWPVSDIVLQQNAVITDGVESKNILFIPLSNALGGCVTQATIHISGIIGSIDAFSGVSGQITVYGMYDAQNDSFWLNGNSSVSSIPVVLNLVTSDTTLALSSAQVFLSGTSGPGVQNIVVSVTGINAYFVNWNAYVQYFTTQSTSNI